jgi:Transposase
MIYTRLIGSGKAENVVQVAKSLQEMTNQSISAQIVRNRSKNIGMKAVVKKKCPLLSKRHRRERLDFVISHKDWTLEDLKKVVWSDETKNNCLGSDGRKWAWKRAGEGLSDRIVAGTIKFGGGSLMMWGCMMWEGVGYG